MEIKAAWCEGLNYMYKNCIKIFSVLFVLGCCSSKVVNNPVGFYGKLSSEEYNHIYNFIETNTSKTLDRSKPTLINFIQKGEICFMEDFPEIRGSVNIVISNIESISGRITQTYDSQNLLIYTSESWFNKQLDDNPNWTLDNGNFTKEIFTSDKCCEAYLIIKPNGEFYKYYGSDYFSKVKELFEAKNWDFLKE